MDAAGRVGAVSDIAKLLDESAVKTKNGGAVSEHKELPIPPVRKCACGWVVSDRDDNSGACILDRCEGVPVWTGDEEPEQPGPVAAERKEVEP